MSPCWTVEYAEPELTLKARLETPTFWRVGRFMHEEASWHVIPIHHPAAKPPNNDPGYEKTLKLLSKLRSLGAV